MTTKEFYEKIEGNYDEALSRMFKDDMIRRFACLFLEDTSMSELMEALDENNVEKAFRAAHTMKGTCNNLAFGRLAVSAVEITEMLRAGNIDGAKAYFPVVSEDYDYVIGLLEELVNEE